MKNVLEVEVKDAEVTSSLWVAGSSQGWLFLCFYLPPLSAEWRAQLHQPVSYGKVSH